MSAVFLKLLNMSITASWLILAVLGVRLLLKKAPRWIVCLLWALAGLRLLLPFSLKSIFSLIPSAETVPANIAVSPAPAIHTGISVFNSAVNPIITETFAPKPAASVNPLQTVLFIASIVWAVGVAAMLLYALISFLRLRKTVAAAVPVGKRILLCDEVRTPFILGVFRPKICLPSSMRGETLDCVIAHETAHLKRRDHWWKPLGFLLLSVYWFNPLCWVAYILLCRDIEMACDEKVIRDMDRDSVAAYSQALLDCGVQRKSITACPLAFGEVSVKQRVKGILKYKKPAFWIILIALVVCVAIAVCLLTDPRSEESPAEQELSAALQPFMDALNQPDMGGMTMTGYVKSSTIADARKFSPEELIAFIAEDDSNGDVIYVDNDELRQYKTLLSRIRPENFVLAQASYGSVDVQDYLVFESKDHEKLLEITAFGFSGETGEVNGIETPYTLFLNGVEVKLDDDNWDTICGLLEDGRAENERQEPTLARETEEPVILWDSERFGYLCDLTGDGVPERCVSVWVGSGLVDERIVVDDEVTGATYELSDRGRYDYRLYEQNGELLVEKRRFSGWPVDGELLAIGRLELDGNELRFVPIPLEWNQNVMELLTRVYSDDELTQMQQFKGTLSELRKTWQVECLRETPSTQYVVYRGENDLVFLYFDRAGKLLGRPDRGRMAHSSEEFREIRVGDTLDDVMAFDPDGSYYWLYTGIQPPPVSLHCTTDGCIISIEYDNENVITKIEIRMI